MSENEFLKFSKYFKCNLARNIKNLENDHNDKIKTEKKGNGTPRNTLIKINRVLIQPPVKCILKRKIFFLLRGRLPCAGIIYAFG